MSEVPLEAAMELLHQGMNCDTTFLSAYIWALAESGPVWLEPGLLANGSSSWSSSLPSCCDRQTRPCGQSGAAPSARTLGGM